jgi:hypothetical protein
MFERLTERAARAAAKRAEAEVRKIEIGLKAELPPGLSCEAGAEGVVISGRRLALRYVTDPALRALLARRS